MSREKGFVLLDALVGLMIVCLGVSCLATASAGARQALFLSQWKNKAVDACTSELETLKSNPIDELIGSGELSPGHVTAKTRDDINLEVESQYPPAYPGLLQVKITGTWNYGPGNGSVVFETYLPGS